MKSPRQLLIVGVLSLVACEVRAATFELINQGLGLTNPLAFTVDGIKLSLSGGSSYNSTATSFGIDSFGTTDDPLLIDVTETLFFQFDQAVLIDSIVVSLFDGQDAGGVLFKAAGIQVPLQNGTMNFGGLRLGIGGSDRIFASLGNLTGGTRGFSIDRITVRPVPEPAAIALAAAALLSVSANRRDKF